MGHTEVTHVYGTDNTENADTVYYAVSVSGTVGNTNIVKDQLGKHILIFLHIYIYYLCFWYLTKYGTYVGILGKRPWLPHPIPHQENNHGGPMTFKILQHNVC